jgi:hypothetical protein
MMPNRSTGLQYHYALALDGNSRIYVVKVDRIATNGRYYKPVSTT